MIHTVTTIPQMLISTYGNQTEVAKRLKCNRNTVRKYVDDKTRRFHSVVNGVLMVSTTGSKRL